jgi:predicted Zn-dependent peptidase
MKNSSQVSMFMMKHIGVIDEPTQHRLTLLNLMLGGYFGSRLMQELRENQGLTYGIGSSFRPTYNERAWTVSGEMNSTNAEKALEETLKIMHEFSRTKVTTDELEKAKRYYSGSFRSGFDGPFSSLIKCQNLIIRNLNTDHYRKTLKNIWETDPNQILETANQYLNPKEFQLSLAGDI